MQGSIRVTSKLLRDLNEACAAGKPKILSEAKRSSWTLGANSSGIQVMVNLALESRQVP